MSASRSWIGLRRVLELVEPREIDQVLRARDGDYEQVPRMYGRFFRHVTGSNTSSARREQARPRRRLLHRALHARHLGALEGMAARRAGEAAADWLTRGWVAPADLRVLGIRTVLDMLFGPEWERQCPELEPLTDLRQTAFERAGAATFPWSPAAMLPRWRSRALERRFDWLADRVEPGSSCIIGWLAEEPDLRAAREEAFSLLWSGRIGVARTLAWALVEMAYTEPVVDRAAREARGGRRERPYLQALVRETLRLHPPLPRVLRVAELDSRLADGRAVPRRTTISLQVKDLQRDAEAFPRPELFRPERFLEHGPDRRNFVAFGAGSRICPGRALAMVEMVAVLAELLRRGKPVAPPQPMPPRDRLPELQLPLTPIAEPLREAPLGAGAER